ncbi:hypothetical protein IH785_16080 [candidate division KSB1 bacterium]|nr:hypothetical protein [candidate division KSB1 bacterium]
MKEFQTIEINPSPHLLTDSGLLYFRLGNYPVAIERFTKALGISPNKGRLYRYLGEANWRIRNYKGMVHWNRKIIGCFPNDLGGWQNLALAYKALGQRKQFAQVTRHIDAINRRNFSLKKFGPETIASEFPDESFNPSHILNPF